MRFQRIAAIALSLAIGQPAHAGQGSGDAPLTRQSLQGLAPAQVARRVLGELAGAVRSVDIDDLIFGDFPLSNVTLTFQPRPMSPGICVESLLTIFFTAIDRERTFGPNPETAPVRAVDFRTEERFRVTGRLRATLPVDARDQADGGPGCAAGHNDALYFSAGGTGPIMAAVEAVELALIDLRGEAEAQSMIGNLVQIEWERCASLESNCLRVVARTSRNGYRRDPDGYAVTVDAVRYNGRDHVVSIGRHEVAESMIITH